MFSLLIFDILNMLLLGLIKGKELMDGLIKLEIEDLRIEDYILENFVGEG